MNARSMTGYARVRKVFDGSEVVASIKSVNHRGLDLHFRISPDLDPFENALRSLVKQQVARGHVQVQIRYVPARGEAPARVNSAMLDAYITAFRRMSAVHGLGGDPDLNAALRVPGMFDNAEEEPSAEVEGHLVATVTEALRLLNEFREREGGEIAADMRERTREVLRAARQIEEIRARAMPEFQARLAARLAEMLAGAAVDPQRLAQEAAYLADRSDISEELTRLKVHAVQLDDLLAGGGEIGKKLDFLMQEMHRETNTILSKSAGAGEAGLEISELALAVKTEVERIREQGLNLE